MASWDPMADTLIMDHKEEMVEVPISGENAGEEQERSTVSWSSHAEGAEEDRSPEGPRKRMKIDQDLETYENLEAAARNVLERTHTKLSPEFQDKMTDGMKYLKENLNILMKKKSLDPICIGVLGHTGVGKTSLFNAIIGQEMLLPVSGITSCTSCIVQVSASRNSENYEAKIHLLSEEEWNEELRDIVEILRTKQDGNESGYTDNDVEDAIAKLHALYGSGSENKSYTELLNTKPQEPIPAKRIIEVEEKVANNFSDRLDTYITIQNESKFKLWPLLKYVEVNIPGSDIVPRGITFMDIPGTGDFNKKRDEMWKQKIDKCSVLWIISAFPRVDSEKDLKVFLNASIDAYQCGMCTDISLVVTKSDYLKLSEYNRERRNRHPGPPLDNKRKAILERNADVKEEMKKKIQEFKGRLSNSEIINKPNMTYTVSVEEFWESNHLDKEDTEIPKLREYVKTICLNGRKKLVEDYVAQVRGILVLVESIGSGHHLLKKHFPESVEQFVNTIIQPLSMNIERCWEEIKHSFAQGVQKAKENYETIVDDMLKGQGKKGNQGFHKTLKALCLKNGVHASKVVGRIDFNKSLAGPIYEVIGDVYVSVFRIQDAPQINIWTQLEMFKKQVQDKLCEIGRENSLSGDNNINEASIYPIQGILRKLTPDIHKMKNEIYKTPANYIQDQLMPHYKVASQISGRNSCEEMKESLKNSIKDEVTNKMFENAQKKMEEELQKLKEMVVTNLQDETLNLFRLVLQLEQQAVKLPDITEECNEIREIHKRLN